jgi:hypothetical protein
MSRESRARCCLQLDAVYCAAAGLLALGLAAPLGGLFGIPRALVTASGVVTILWAVALALLARREQWRSPLALVGGANALAASGIAVAAFVVAGTGARALLVAVAFEVAAFAAIQVGLLRD